MPAGRRAGLIAALLLVAAVGVPARAANDVVTVAVDASHPGRPINQALIGINQPVDGTGPAMQAIGVHWARLDAWFQGSGPAGPDYNCATGAWNSGQLDRRVARAREAGAEPMVLVDYTPACLAAPTPPGLDPTHSAPDIGADRVKWDALVTRMVSHELAAGVRSFEIWNEPDGTFWNGGLPGYLLLYDDTARVIEAAAAAAHVRVEVGGPALLFSDSSWIEPFLAFVSARGLPLDFLSWHYYADYPLFGPMAGLAPPPGTPPFWYNPALRAQTFGLQVMQVRAEVAKFPALRPALWIDEWNANAGYDARQSGPFDAALVAAVLDSVQAAGLDRMCFFFVADDASNPLGNWGLLDARHQPKPVYEAFRLWHEMASRQLPVTLSPDQSTADLSGGRIGGVASMGDDGTVTVLVYDFVPYDPTGSYATGYRHQIALAIDGLGPRPYAWTSSLIDETHLGTPVGRGRVNGPGARIGLPLQSESVALVTLRPSS